VSFPSLVAGSVFFLAAAIFCFSTESASTEADKSGLPIPVEHYGSSLISLNSDELDQRISVQRHIVEMNQGLLNELQMPEPIYATERSAVPLNREEIADHNADFNEYSAAITTAKGRLRALLDAKEQLND
jgi:hypothetical protein